MPHRKISPPANAGESARIVNWRLLFKVVIKRSILLGRTVQGLGQSVHSEANKIVTEAREELDQEQRGGSN